MNEKEPKSPFVATTVYGASIGLIIDVGIPYETVIERNVFPEGTALRRALELPEVVEAGGPWPFLDRITISYGLLFDRWREEHPSGFNVEIGFVASRKDKILGSKNIRCSIASGLDPLKDHKGTPVQKDHQPADTLQDPEYHGGNEGWHGYPDEIEKNKALYLRATPEKEKGCRTKK